MWMIELAMKTITAASRIGSHSAVRETMCSLLGMSGQIEEILTRRLPLLTVNVKLLSSLGFLEAISRMPLGEGTASFHPDAGRAVPITAANSWASAPEVRDLP